MLAFVSLMQHQIDGKTYYTFEFMAKAPNYTRHALSTISIGNGMKLGRVSAVCAWTFKCCKLLFLVMTCIARYRKVLHFDDRVEWEEVGEDERQITHNRWFLQTFQILWIGTAHIGVATSKHHSALYRNEAKL